MIGVEGKGLVTRGWFGCASDTFFSEKSVLRMEIPKYKMVISDKLENWSLTKMILGVCLEGEPNLNRNG